MNRKHITKTQKAEIERYQRGLSHLHTELSSAKSPEAVLSIADDIHTIATNIRRIAETSLHPPITATQRRSASTT